MPSVRRSPVALVLVGAVASFLTLLAPPPTLGVEHAVEIGDSVFSPASLTIGVGDTVTWRNADDRPHTVTSNDGAFDSGNLDEGQGFSFTFTEPGTYTYRCDYHADMQATIVVEAASAPASASGGSTASGTDAPATGDGAADAAAAPHAPGHDAGQPDTALQPPISLAWIAPLLIGLGLVAFAFGLVPPAREAVRERSRSAGWRR
jgi:plastocyanin